MKKWNLQKAIDLFEIKKSEIILSFAPLLEPTIILIVSSTLAYLETCSQLGLRFFNKMRINNFIFC